MKKVGVLFILLLFSFALVPLALSEDEEIDTDSEDYRINEAFNCLEEKADDCSDLSNEEIALTILATPANIFDECVEELKDREDDDNWGNIKDTSLAILALRHAGEDTVDYEAWLLEKEQTPTNLEWYIQQDSEGETECAIGYDDFSYDITIGEGKKIIDTPGQSGEVGNCLSLSDSEFWLKIETSCYNKEFEIQCDRGFIANLLYKNEGSSTIYVLEGTKEGGPDYDPVSLGIQSKCFGMSGCDYEATAWALMALSSTENDLEDFIPYLVAMASANAKYMPNAFIYMLTEWNDYANQLVVDQKSDGYWYKNSLQSDKFYDTSLALISLGYSQSEAIDDAKEWLFEEQRSDGCWQNSIKDTAIVLWSLDTYQTESSFFQITSDDITIDENATENATEDGITTGGNGGPSSTRCTQANYFCVYSSDCPESQLMGNFYCPGVKTCCESENLKTCSESNGQECLGNTRCVGNKIGSSDVDECCTGTCEEIPEESECEQNSYTCANSCFDYQEPASYDCYGGEVCCREKIEAKEEDRDEGKSLVWVWVLLILILVTLGALAYIYRDKLKEKLKKKGGDKASSGRPPRGVPPRPGFPPRGVPPRPGFPPVVRPQVANRRPNPRYREDPAMKETFRKLRTIAAK